LIWPKDRFTRFEVARLIGARALQISLGAPVLVKEKKGMTPIELAKLEFKNQLMPITVKRTLPSGETVIVDTKEAIKHWVENHKGEF